MKLGAGHYITYETSNGNLYSKLVWYGDFM